MLQNGVIQLQLGPALIAGNGGMPGGHIYAAMMLQLGPALIAGNGCGAT